ncbi:MAG: hypothetical protein CSB47_04950 [Proteobacteria bacterium]|nr:MAG: hypothetical protein CSB47_04950 [Pseudomonadota bacterium]
MLKVRDQHNHAIEGNYQIVRQMFHHSGSFLRLKELLVHLQDFHSLIIQHNNPAYRDGLIQQLHTSPPNQQVLDLKELGDFHAFEQRIANLEKRPASLHVINLESLDDNTRQAFFRGINYHREYIARQLNATRVIWVIESQIRDIALHAADFWAWREQVLDFSLPDEITKVLTEEQNKFRELAKEHPDDTDKLQDRAIRQWLIWEENTPQE